MIVSYRVRSEITRRQRGENFALFLASLPVKYIRYLNDRNSVGTNMGKLGIVRFIVHLNCIQMTAALVTPIYKGNNCNSDTITRREAGQQSRSPANLRIITRNCHIILLIEFAFYAELPSQADLPIAL